MMLKGVRNGLRNLRREWNVFRQTEVRRLFYLYQDQMRPNHPFYDAPKKLVGDCSVPPIEFFSHYDGYAYWLAQKLALMGDGKRILDVGNTKRSNALNSLRNQVTACVLMDCRDQLSKVEYIIHDVGDRLPFDDHTFDVFTSAVSLQLIGLGRYGDRLDPYSLPKLVAELNRVMKPESDLIFSVNYGLKCLDFNNHYVFDLETLQNVFSNWALVDYLIDNDSRAMPKRNQRRYTQDTAKDDEYLGDCRVIFLHFKRKNLDSI